MTILQGKKSDNKSKYYASKIDFHNNPPFDLFQEVGALFSMDYRNVQALVQFAISWQEQVEAAEKELLKRKLDPAGMVYEDDDDDHANPEERVFDVELEYFLRSRLPEETAAKPRSNFRLDEHLPAFYDMISTLTKVNTYISGKRVRALMQTVFNVTISIKTATVLLKKAGFVHGEISKDNVIKFTRRQNH